MEHRYVTARRGLLQRGIDNLVKSQLLPFDKNQSSISSSTSLLSLTDRCRSRRTLVRLALPITMDLKCDAETLNLCRSDFVVQRLHYAAVGWYRHPQSITIEFVTEYAKSGSSLPTIPSSAQEALRRPPICLSTQSEERREHWNDTTWSRRTQRRAGQCDCSKEDSRSCEGKR